MAQLVERHVDLGQQGRKGREGFPGALFEQVGGDDHFRKGHASCGQFVADLDHVRSKLVHVLGQHVLDGGIELEAEDFVKLGLAERAAVAQVQHVQLMPARQHLLALLR